MKAMKIKIIVSLAMATIFILTSTVNATSQSPLNDDDSPELEVKVEARNLFRGWYLIWTTVKNLEDERITLLTGRPAGGFVIYNESGTEIHREPEYTILIIERLSLWPHQRKILYLGLWNMRWHPANKYIIYGVMHGYDYKGKTYPPIESVPVTVYPPFEAV